MRSPAGEKGPTRARLSGRNAPRRWCIPRALQHEPGELLEAAELLDELPSPAGVLLWQSLRDVMLWNEAAPPRAGLFVPGAGERRRAQLQRAALEPGLEVSLTTLAALLDAPAKGEGELIGLVCRQLSRWAAARHAPATALAFAQAGAGAAPRDPAAALAAARAAAAWGREARAETWLRRALGVARRTRAWDAYAEAHCELGALLAERGDAASARRAFTLALRASRRHGLLALRGAALHGLLRLALERGALDDAERLGRGALRAYGRAHPRLGELEHDLARLWVRTGEGARAVPVLQRLLTARVEPVERAFTLAVLAHAAAGSADPGLYRESWQHAWSILSRRAGEERRHTAALGELARAAALARDPERVEQAEVLSAAAAAAPPAVRR